MYIWFNNEDHQSSPIGIILSQSFFLNYNYREKNTYTLIYQRTLIHTSIITFCDIYPFNVSTNRLKNERAVNQFP